MRFIIGFFIALFPSFLLGAAYQIFHTLAYDNAAKLNSIGQARLIFGVTDPLVDISYSGQINTQNGSVSSHTDTFLPYLSIGYRINPKSVLAFEITHPIFANIQFPETSFVNTVATDSIIFDTNYSPKLSLQLTDHIALGIGFDANNVSNAQVNFMDAGTEVINKSQGWQYGWDAGIAIQLNKTNFLNFSYYSKINFDQLTGYSQQGVVRQNNFSNNVVIPDTYTLNLTHLLSETWLIFETIHYIQWSEANYLAMRNSAIGSFTIPLNYHDSASFLIGARHQLREKWSITGIVEYQTSPQSTQYRPIGLPTSALTVIGADLEHTFHQNWTVDLRNTYIFANPPIHQSGPPLQNGQMAINVIIIDAGLTWKI